MRARKVVKMGGTHYISIYKQDLTDYGLKEGSEVDIEDIIKVNKRKKK